MVGFGDRVILSFHKKAAIAIKFLIINITIEFLI